MTPLTPPEESTDSCYSCQALRGERHISPAEHIYDGLAPVADVQAFCARMRAAMESADG